MELQKKIVWIVSDGTGRTAAQLIRAAAYQFEDPTVEYRTLRDVTSEQKIVDIFDKVKQEGGMIVYTIVSHSGRMLIHRLAAENHILAVDLFGPLISTMQKYFKQIPLESPGLSYKINRDYFRMIDAVDFTIKHDDGANISSIADADIILLGPSRVGKTPLAVYLAYMGWKVANIPIVKGIDLPEEVARYAFKVFCLIIDPELLRERRLERIKKLGDPKISGYAELDSITDELQQCRRISDEGRRFPLIEVTNRPVEDLAKEIIQLVSI